ncbi:HAD family hydrolase [Kitasatospora sp. NPDC051853]|uniref:HAD family hydrolase n=1 Tax=Kitasatospora sp. NPDC051853 TaxID=3364058 RepID=UPI0037B59782
MQRLALFDLDGTLLDRDAAFAAWAREFADSWRLGEGALDWLMGEDARHSGPMGGFFVNARERFGLGPSVEELWGRYRARMPELIGCPPAALAALAKLREAGWRTAIVTNGGEDVQLAKIRRTGLAELVDAWCVSEEAGVRKPEPGIFRLAAERCGAVLDHGGWMVGDRLSADIAGGQGVGLRTAWLPGRRVQEEAPAGVAPDVTVASVPEAVRVILTADGN